MLKNALEYSLEYLDKISSSKPNERLPKEEQLRCALFSFYTSKGYLVHPEAAYFPADDGNKEECDLRVITSSKEHWIEIKTARCASHLQTKTTEEVGRWEKDGWKLENAPENADKIFILYTFTENHPDETDSTFFKAIRDLWADYAVTRACTKKFSWRDTSVNYVTAWYWQW